MATNDDWLAQVTEEALEPDLPIGDTHHHLWDQRFMDTLGVACDPTAYGPSTADWNAWLADAVQGEKGRSFLGKVPVKSAAG